MGSEVARGGTPGASPRGGRGSAPHGGWRGRYRGKGRDPGLDGGGVEGREVRAGHGHGAARERPPSRRGRRMSSGGTHNIGPAMPLPDDEGAAVEGGHGGGWAGGEAGATEEGTETGAAALFDSGGFNVHLKALADRAVAATRRISELERALSLSEEGAAVAVAGVARAQAEMGFMAERVRTLTQTVSVIEEERDEALREARAAQLATQARSDEIRRLRGETVGNMGWEEAGRLEAELEAALQRVRAEQKRTVERELRQKAVLEEGLGKSISRLRVDAGRDSDPQCIVCCESKRSCVLIPCGHSCMCGPCAERVVCDKGTCPVCRGAVSMVQPVFES